jgi:integrase
MGRVFKPKYRDRHGEAKQVRDWYAEWTAADGSTDRKKVGKDKRLAHQFLARMEEEAARARAGVDPAPSADRARPLLELLEDYLSLLAARDTSPDYRKLCRDYLTRTLTSCRWLVWADVRADGLTRFLGRRRDDHGNGPATLNSYLRVAKGFTNWLADRLGVANPLRKMKPYPEEVDRRRSRSILTGPELKSLLAAAEAAPRRGRATVRGPDRAKLYLVAAYTGLRASELNELTVEDFALDADPPRVTVPARESKGKRAEPVPLPRHVADALRPWLAGKTGPLWPGNWSAQRKQVAWLARDLKRAGITDRRVTFHSLKRAFVVRLLEAGGEVHKVRRMARHRDVKTTLNYYAETNLPDLGDLADRLPPPG